ncbi:MAG: hypothetical protein ACFE8N_11205 [Promethearchaeota archaeon]
MVKKILCIDTDYDDVVRSFLEGRKEVYRYFETKGFEVIRIQGEEATRKTISEIALDEDVVYITGSGHGTEASFKGHKYRSIFKKRWSLLRAKGYLEDEVKNKIIHLLSCSSAKILGIDFVKNGCKAFFGYDKVVQLDPDYNQIYSTCDAEIDYAIADGCTAEEAFDRAVQFYKDAIEVLDERNSEYISLSLKRNLECLKGPTISPWGSRNATIS